MTNSNDTSTQPLPPELGIMVDMMNDGASAYDIGYAVAKSLYGNLDPDELASFGEALAKARAEGDDDFVRGGQAWLDEVLASQ